MISIEIKNQSKILIILSFFIFVSYIFGFLLNENHGASKTDAEAHTWPAIIEFSKLEILEVLKNYYKFGENSYPLHHIIYGKILNIDNTAYIKTTSSLLSISIPFLFFLILKNKYKQISKINLVFFSFIIFLSTYFRSSAIWGLTENTGYFFLLLSIFFFEKFIKTRNLTFVFYTCLFSSLALYARPQLIFFSIFFYLTLLMFKKNKEIFIGTIFYSLLSLPGIFLAYTWGGLLVDESGINNFNYFINFKSIPNSFLSVISLFFVYAFPFYIINQINILDKINLKKNIYLFIKCLLVVTLIYLIFDIDFAYLSFEDKKIYGQGFLIDILFRFTGIKFLVLPFIAFGLLITVYLSKLSKKNFILISIIILVYSLRVHFFTEYFDPLLYIIFFLLFDFNNIFFERLKEISTQLFFLIYYLLILCGAILV